MAENRHPFLHVGSIVIQRATGAQVDPITFNGGFGSECCTSADKLMPTWTNRPLNSASPGETALNIILGLRPEPIKSPFIIGKLEL